MNEEIEYAKMLEIPVSTVNVVPKKRRFRAKKNDLKEKLITKINNRADGETETTDFASDEPQEETFDAELKTLDFSPEPVQEREPPKTKSDRRAGIALTVEFGIACALCATIFLTNAFMPTSAINTFFRSFGENKVAETKKYSDFALKSVVSELSNADVELSENGVISFSDACCVYPTVDGKVKTVFRNADGTYDVTVGHTDDFYSVTSGLSSVYYKEGESVYAGVPMGYTNGENVVRVMMYSDEELLSCLQQSEGGIAWTEAQ